MTLFISLSLILASAWIIRGIIFGKLSFSAYMVWNMILAVIPVLLIYLIAGINNSRHGSGLMVIMLLLGTAWLLFLPNSFYLLTDMMHLNQDVLVNKKEGGFTKSLQYVRGDSMYTLDSFLMFLTALFGAIVGGISLNKFNNLLNINPVLHFAVVSIIVFLVAIGVHIGRYGRWNSWDAFIKPKKVLTDFFVTVKTKDKLNSFILFVMTIVAFELVSWVLVLNYK